MVSVNLADRGVCPLCGSQESDVHIPFPEIPVLRCGACGFTYSSKVLSGEEMTAYYENNFGSQRQLQGQLVNSVVNSMALEQLVNFDEIHTMLDVGTGYGFLIKELCKRHKLEAVGVELSRQEAEYAKNVLGLNVIDQLLCNSGLSKGSYDLVTAFEVIEHIPSPIEFIHELTEYLRPGGYLAIMTDNFESDMAKSLGAGFPKWIPHTHVSHFSATTLKKTLSDVKQLEIVKSLSYTPWEVVLRNAYYKVRGIKKTPSQAFNLQSTLETEMQNKYKLFRIRKLFNRTWVKFNLSERMNGDLMFFVCRKKPG